MTLDFCKFKRTVQSALLAAEDLVRTVNSLILPAEHFLENASVRNLLDAKNNLAKLLEL